MLGMKIDDDRVRKALNRSARGVSTHVRREWNAAGELLVEVMKKCLSAAGRGDGRLGRAIAYRLTDRRGLMELEAGPRVGDPGVEPYDEVIEGGRRKGAKMPPAGVLDEWMSTRGIPAEAEYLIRRSIAENGIQASPYMRPAFEQVGPLAAASVTRIGEAVVRDFDAG
ncbi:MAG: hypothetical protein ABI780_01715 [Ardenticatenales bacterium]